MSEYIVSVDDFEESYYRYTDIKPETIFGYRLREKIVRCRDCRYSEKGYWCRYFGKYGDLTTVTPDGFCSFGERREQ